VSASYVLLISLRTHSIEHSITVNAVYPGITEGTFGMPNEQKTFDYNMRAVAYSGLVEHGFRQALNIPLVLTSGGQRREGNPANTDYNFGSGLSRSKDSSPALSRKF